jgi:hypothetical protein
MAPEKSKKTAARRQRDRVKADMVLDADDQGENHGHQKKNDINGVFF